MKEIKSSKTRMTLLGMAAILIVASALVGMSSISAARSTNPSDTWAHNMGPCFNNQAEPPTEGESPIDPTKCLPWLDDLRQKR